MPGANPEASGSDQPHVERQRASRPKDGERVLDFSMGQAHLSLRYEQLLIRRDGMPDLSAPIEDLAVVVLASRRLTCTLPLLDALMRHGVSVVISDESMHPSGLLLPLEGHFEQTKRMIAQATAKLPVKKRVWQQIVTAKVRAQAANLICYRGGDAGLMALARRVRSGDPANVESQAAQRYWPHLFDDPAFRRRRDAPDQNRLLNYGYAVLRATVARAVVASGLHPSLGVHHHARGNAFCLSDYLMEPYRPIIDAEVVEIVGEWGGDIGLDGMIKERLVGALHARVGDRGEDRTAFEWIARSAASLARILAGEDPEERLFFPGGLFPR